ncbi:MAG: hypothetical protein PHF70_03925 [Opitutales bacterium]|nr:hypothetical protein [Opitutales bacterium]
MNTVDPAPSHQPTHPKVRAIPCAPIKVKKTVAATAKSSTAPSIRVKPVAMPLKPLRSHLESNGTVSHPDALPSRVSALTQADEIQSGKTHSFTWDIAFAVIALVFSFLILLKY